MPTPAEAKIRRAEVHRLGLSVPPIYDEIDDATLGVNINGIGPDAFPHWLRATTTRLFSVFLPAADVHDIEYTFGDGTREQWHEANRRFQANCEACLQDEVRGLHWWQILQRRALRKEADFLFYEVETEIAYRSYLAACNRRRRVQP